jgi:hypothetical protein
MNNPPAPVQKGRVLTLFLWPILASILCVVFFYLYLTQWTESLIPRLVTEIPPIVTIRESSGNNYYRDHHDMIWLKVKSGNEHTIGDALETSSRGSILISFVNQPVNTIRIQPSSLVRLLQVGDRILIQVKKGQVVSDFKTMDDVLIQTPDGKISDIQPKSMPTKEPDDAKKDDSTPSTDSPKESTPRQMGLHYPANNSIVIYKDSQSVKFRINRNCAETCVLIISMNETVLVQKPFQAGQAPEAQLSWKTRTAGKVTWSLRQNTTSENLSGQFELAPYTDHAFETALKSGQPIELLD